jgi:hypothetical protein
MTMPTEADFSQNVHLSPSQRTRLSTILRHQALLGCGSTGSARALAELADSLVNDTELGKSSSSRRAPTSLRLLNVRGGIQPDVSLECFPFDRKSNRNWRGSSCWWWNAFLALFSAPTDLNLALVDFVGSLDEQQIAHFRAQIGIGGGVIPWLICAVLDVTKANSPVVDISYTFSALRNISINMTEQGDPSEFILAICTQGLSGVDVDGSPLTGEFQFGHQLLRHCHACDRVVPQRPYSVANEGLSVSAEQVFAGPIQVKMSYNESRRQDALLECLAERIVNVSSPNDGGDDIDPRAYVCTGCGQRGTGQGAMYAQVTELPRVMFIEIGGEEQDSTGRTRYTTHQPNLVNYPVEFSVSDLRDRATDINFEMVTGDYRLWSAMRHQGSHNAGHYDLTKWNPTLRRWLKLDGAEPIVVSNHKPPHYVNCARVLVYVQLDPNARSEFVSTPLGLYFDSTNAGGQLQEPP